MGIRGQSTESRVGRASIGEGDDRVGNESVGGDEGVEAVGRTEVEGGAAAEVRDREGRVVTLEEGGVDLRGLFWSLFCPPFWHLPRPPGKQHKQGLQCITLGTDTANTLGGSVALQGRN